MGDTGGNLRIAICEDDARDSSALSGYIEKSSPDAEISLFESGEDFIASSSAGAYDLVFMDIYLGGKTGVDAAKTLRELDMRVEIVFTTSSQEHALDAYRVRASRYLVKPVDEGEVRQILSYASSRKKTPEPVCSVTVNYRSVNIPLSRISHVEVFGHRCLIHMLEETVAVNCAINHLEAQLDSPEFFRCHRSFIVNFKHVKEVGRDFVMKNGEKAYIRKNGVKEATDAYRTWLMESVWRNEI